jgi:hypothetical protein
MPTIAIGSRGVCGCAVDDSQFMAEIFVLTLRSRNRREDRFRA